MSWAKTSSLSEAGPRVATIFVRLGSRMDFRGTRECVAWDRDGQGIISLVTPALEQRHPRDNTDDPSSAFSPADPVATRKSTGEPASGLGKDPDCFRVFRRPQATFVLCVMGAVRHSRSHTRLYHRATS